MNQNCYDELLVADIRNFIHLCVYILRQKLTNERGLRHHEEKFKFAYRSFVYSNKTDKQVRNPSVAFLVLS
jgi:hypothetical protein